MSDETTIKASKEDIAVKRLEVTNLIYDFINDTSLMPNLIDGLAGLDEIDPNADDIFEKLSEASRLADKLHDIPDIDITRDVGLLVVGVNHHGNIALVPPGAEDWLGKKFKPSKQGIDWLTDQNGMRCLAHYIEFGAKNHLPIHKALIEGLKNKIVVTLIAIYRFDLSESAMNALKELYHLTPAEMRLCNHLGQGLSLKDSAVQLGVGAETNRTHLKRIFQKMGINSQNELVRIITQISAASSIYDVTRKHNLDLVDNQKNSIQTTHTAYIRTRHGSKLCYSCYGDPDGEPLLFFHHTIGCRILSDDMINDAYKAGKLIYTFDRPGYGGSEPIDNYCPKILAECTEDFLDAHGLQQVDALALAISGRSVLEAIPYMKGRMKTLDLYSFRGVSPPHDPTHIWNHFIYLLIKNAKYVGPMVRLLKSAFTNQSVVKNMQSAYGSSPPDQQYVSNPKNCFYLLNVLQLACSQNGVGPSYEFTNLRKEFRANRDDYSDTLIRAFFGEHDRYNPLEDAQDFLKQFPNLSVKSVPNAGQLFLFARFKEFLSLAR
ncbi:LuxR C-terminal-related transcriptional regulator [Kordiimonas sp. SCSIO 12610]|uniref:LuxR C-terminal-related transcriptional regulator n=1 Tax=Kordiimonas sp. SCSIO 12610 TaxID=2829597 RepID=UPI0021090EF3|nr:LuxR C-terminal-related transcriptional regulator [Kordiimonas sp. SCSIO 12610]UTW54383.1 hypothetical protein KFF44_11215 [Kordiimonas sp. SCSIO 12610]